MKIYSEMKSSQLIVGLERIQHIYLEHLGFNFKIVLTQPKIKKLSKKKDNIIDIN